ncbi:heavy metal transporter [Curtobacterium sp. MCPF17_047]|uniref:heavy-metal-associated domain-containing protein n=1 Tax=unclassified Curtobacterium TaxID=257496 RepID=UPI000DA7D274|nr:MULTISPECIES: heavy-metal-associated domain-containing protein [unclassified Curtobacterium]PZE62821.1 heavy metal transporter [Curtobacterium sp. MCPF17_001]PZF65607.1 heavy metal transporter [Curtobacterium sp. MCPF17_047]WIB11516.1 heavy-metal-associated domain-containing protein [Curtobacterium sp. MCPF17_052]
MTEQQTVTYGIDGMTCEHCVMSIDEAFRELPGVTDVQVDLVAGGRSTATVTSAAPLDGTAVDAAVEDAGYTLAER